MYICVSIYVMSIFKPDVKNTAEAQAASNVITNSDLWKRTEQAVGRVCFKLPVKSVQRYP